MQSRTSARQAWGSRPFHLRGLNQGHGPGERLAAAVGPGEELVLPADPDRAHGALGWIVVDRDASVLEEQLEGRSA